VCDLLSYRIGINQFELISKGVEIDKKVA
jgi:hypothetical protein